VCREILFDNQIHQWLGSSLYELAFFTPLRSVIDWKAWGRQIFEETDGIIDQYKYTNVVFWFLCKNPIGPLSMEASVLLEPAIQRDTSFGNLAYINLRNELPKLVQKHKVENIRIWDEIYDQLGSQRSSLVIDFGRRRAIPTVTTALRKRRYIQSNLPSVVTIR
jgi:hypothetical protein